MLTDLKGKIQAPSHMQNKCSEPLSYLMESYTCYYQIRLTQKNKISIEFRNFKLFSGSLTNCLAARQYMVVITGTEDKRYVLFI